MLIKPDLAKFAKIKVIGIGGGGCNAINTMISSAQIKGVDFIAVNTDAQALTTSQSPVKIQIGENLTKGLGSGADPEIGRQAAEESKEKIKDTLIDSDMIFITCGMGGGTGTGGSSVIADIAKSLNILTVGVVTKPFVFEGTKRLVFAEEGISVLKEKVDTLIVIPNQRLLDVIDRKMSLLEAFKVADSVLSQAVQGISDLITMPGLINVDFADVRTIMTNSGSALMGMGTGVGENRAQSAARMAISSPLLEIAIDGAKGILFNITGGEDITMAEVDEAAKIISEKADADANIIFGATIDDSIVDQIKITVIATGFDENRTRLSHMLDNKPKITPSPSLPYPQFNSSNLYHSNQPSIVKPQNPRPINTPKPPATGSQTPTQDDKSPVDDDIFDIPAFLRQGK